MFNVLVENTEAFKKSISVRDRPCVLEEKMLLWYSLIEQKEFLERYFLVFDLKSIQLSSGIVLLSKTG